MRPCRATMVAVLCLPAFGASTAPATIQEITLALTGATVVDVEAGRRLPAHTVLIAGDRIAAVGPDAEVPPPPSARRVDARGLFVVPGLWDAHAHLSYWGEEALRLLVGHGVTSVREMGGDPDEIEAWKQRVEAGEIIGPSLRWSGPFLEGSEGGDEYRWKVDSPAAARAAANALLDRGVDFLKIQPRIGREEVAALIEVAAARGSSLVGHVPEGLTAIEAAALGLRSIEHLGPFLRLSDEELEATLEALIEHDTWVSPALFSSVAQLEARGERRVDSAMVRRSYELIRAFHDAGVPLLVGANFAYREWPHRPGSALHGEMEVLVEAGIPAPDVLRMATLGNAAFLGVDASEVRVAVGARADLLLLRGDPLADIGNSRRFAGVVLGGRYLDGAEMARQRARPMTPEEVVETVRIDDPRIAPDGKRVLFVVRHADLESNAVSSAIWMLDVLSGESRPLTHTAAAHDAPRWSPDGTAIAFLSDRGETTQVWRMAAAGGEAEAITAAPGGVAAFAWSPDGRTLAYTATEAQPATEIERREAGDDAWLFDVAEDLPRLWLLDLASGDTRSVTEPELAVQEMGWSPDGSRLVVAARPSTVLDRIGETELYLVDAAGGAQRRLTANAAVESTPRFADPDTILYTASDAQRFINAESKLFRMDVGSGTVARLALDYGYGLADPLPAPGGDGVLMRSGVRTSQRLVEVGTSSGDVRDVVSAPGSVGGFDVAADGTLVYIHTDATRLPELWLREADAESARVMTAMNPVQAEWLLGETRVIRWSSADGSEVEGLLTLPPGHQPGDRHPLVVKLHGGPEAAETLAHDPSYIDYHQLLAGAGWAVLRPNYRGGTNYGDTWVQGMNGDTGGGDAEDIISGVDQLVDIGVADAERLAIMGWSWGGISTGWLVTQTDRFKAASAGAMVSDHFSVFGQADLTFDVEHFYVGGSPWEDPGRYLAMSPIGHVMKATTPTLLLHGEEDERCPLPQSVEFFKGLQAAGVEARLVVYPREPHVFREPRHQLDKIRRELAWFDRHVLQQP